MKSAKIPQIQPHYRVEVVEPKHVYLLDEQSAHALTGRLYCQILPLLDGKHHLDDIYRKLNGLVEREHIDYVLDRLYEKGYLTEATVDLSQEVAAFWSALGVVPSIVIRALEKAVTLMAVGEGIGEKTTASLAIVMKDMGLNVQSPNENDQSTTSSTFQVVLTDDYLQPQLAEINRQALEIEQPWLLVKPVGNMFWVGPIFIPGETGCWDCLAQRLRGNREIETSILRQKQKQNLPDDSYCLENRGDVIGCLPTARATLPSSLQMGLQFAVTEIAKWLVKQQIKTASAEGTPQNPVSFSTLEAKIVTFNFVTQELQTHILSHRPQCPTCGNPQLLRERGFQPITLQPQNKHFIWDGGHRTYTPEQTLQSHQHLISPLTGIVTELVRISDPSNPLVHTYRAGHSFGSATSLRGLRHSLRHKSSGKGKTDSQSRTSGFCEAVERYSGIYQGDEPRILSTLAELGDRAIHPDNCLLFSDYQYANRENLNAISTVVHDWIPQRFDASQIIDWTPVWSLTEQTHKYLPTAFCYYDYPSSKDHHFCRADSNGNAAGNTLEEAILQGFMELVERDSVALWWYNRLKRPSVDLASFDEPYFVELQNFYQKNHRELWVLDLTADLEIPTFAGISRRTNGDSERIIAGFGTHFDPTIAILRAVTEVNQIGLELDKIPLSELQGDFKNWMLSATLENKPYLAPDQTTPLKVAGDYSQRWSDDIYTDVMTCVEIAQQAGLETLVLDQTRPDVGLNVVKVIVPGMRHFWSRFGVGRLYDIPVKLGWRNSPLSEGEMNSTPMPF
ncbi:TOMM precursor leader peptide-binding protein [Anabaena azotica]|uniref:TOMM leader peptide-binding protein n=1 Tax=Anabaena azotica FACHB-119 TaxID=947527 RepID=A0ABR8DEY3_9NOST|nr:TOMM precursor leader peptide-binding protein [Anabaena azotica]MBD2504681.1 TOMM precursor leader peptide-binding protein [Anabaena azotica FACHB-119]